MANVHDEPAIAAADEPVIGKTMAGIDRPAPQFDAAPELGPTRPIPQRPSRAWPIVLVLGAVAAGAAMLIDQRFSDYVTQPGVREPLHAWINFCLASFAYILLLLVLSLFPNGKRLALGFIAALLLSTLITHALKWTIGRARPQTDLGPALLNPRTGDGDFESFPSGHSSGAITLALLLGFYFPRWRGLFVFFGLVVGFERIVGDKHYLSDVLGGFVVGALAVYFCLRLLGPTFYHPTGPPRWLEKAT